MLAIGARSSKIADAHIVPSIFEVLAEHRL